MYTEVEHSSPEIATGIYLCLKGEKKSPSNNSVGVESWCLVLDADASPVFLCSRLTLKSD